MAWGLEGEQLTLKWALALGYSVGWRGRALTTAVAVMTAESGRYTRAWHENVGDDGVVASIDRGLYQLNDKAHPSMSEAAAYHPVRNAEYAYRLSNGGANWTPWYAWVNGAHRKYVPMVVAVKALNTWRNRVAKVGDRWP